jgi:hypothetical protein
MPATYLIALGRQMSSKFELADALLHCRLLQECGPNRRDI